MPARLRAIAALIALGAARPALADDTQNWEAVLVSVKTGARTTLSNQATVRAAQGQGVYEALDTLMLGYALNEHVNVGGGYVHDPHYSHGNFTVMEHRLREQIGYDDVLRLGPARLSGRLRIEQRWREGVGGTVWRLRPSVRASLPLARGLSLQISHESYFNLGTNAFQKVRGLDKMRNALALSLPLSKQLGFELGYLEQHGFVPGGADTNDHVLTTQLSAKF